MRLVQSCTSLLVMCLTLALAASAQPSGNQPDVVGIRPGMAAQDAYNALRARANGSKVGIGQSTIQGIQQPVVTVMALQVMGSSPREEITVYLTFPPQKQVVWNVVRTLSFEAGKEPLRASILDGLRQKYGPETGATTAGMYWTFTEDGQRANATQVMQDGCGNRAYISQVQDFQNPSPTSGYAYMDPVPKCDKYVGIRAEVGNAFSASGALANYVTVGLTDTAIALRSRDAWKAIVDRDNAAARQRELDKANQQQKPPF